MLHASTSVLGYYLFPDVVEFSCNVSIRTIYLVEFVSWMCYCFLFNLSHSAVKFCIFSTEDRLLALKAKDKEQGAETPVSW